MFKISKVNLIRVFVVIIVFIFTASFLNAQIIIKKPSKPAAKVVKPKKPGTNYFWVDGHWQWNPRTKKYDWNRGHWEKERSGYKFVPGHWKKVRRGHKWIPGSWVKVTVKTPAGGAIGSKTVEPAPTTQAGIVVKRPVKPKTKFVKPRKPGVNYF